MSRILKQYPTRVYRSYLGGAVLDRYLGVENPVDCRQPEDWISSFHEAINKVHIPNEGISLVETPDGPDLITNRVDATDYGPGRTDSGVLIKYLDAAERLGIQVHPTREYARENLNCPFGKTECWYVLDVRDGAPGCVYIGFKEHVTEKLWRDLFDRQDTQGMLDALHCFRVEPGQTILVPGGTPHAIGGGCFLLEIQEPTDYTMRMETTLLDGSRLTPMQIHYGVGVDKMLKCYDYTPRTREETVNEYFLRERDFFAGGYTGTHLVTYDDTDCFALDRVEGDYRERTEVSLTLIALESGGSVECGGEKFSLKRGDRFFVKAGSEFCAVGATMLICRPPKN